MINNDSILNAVTRYYDDKRFKAQNTAYEINEKLNQDERWVNNRYAVKDLSLSIAKAEFLGDTNNLNKLKEKGIDEDLANKLLNEQEYDDFESALKLAKKKKIGPYCMDKNLRKERRNKDMGVLIRAGFDYDVVLKVLEFDEEE